VIADIRNKRESFLLGDFNDKTRRKINNKIVGSNYMDRNE